MADLFGIGVSGLLSYQKALTTVSHNIANVNTDGYTRQRVQLGTRDPEFRGNGYVGNGVNVTDITRIYDQFLTEQLRSSISQYNKSDAYYAFAQQVDSLLADPNAGLIPATDRFYNSLQDLANDPSSNPARTVVLGEAASLVSRFKDMYSRLDSIRSGVNTHLTTAVSEINAIASSIAAVNRDILFSPTSGGQVQPNDLLDQRDQLVEKLSDYANVRTVTQSDGTLNVFIGNGVNLVAGLDSLALTTTTDPFDPGRVNVAYAAGGSNIDISNQLTGGKLGGLLDFRSQVLDAALNGLGQVAVAMTTDFNNQHQLGMDLDGDIGGLFFSNITASTSAPNSNNAGTTDVIYTATISDTSLLKASNYRMDFDGTNYTMVRLTDNTTVGSATSIGALSTAVSATEGFTLALTSGSTLSTGDSFQFRPVRSAANRVGLAITSAQDIAAAAPVRVAATTLGASSSATATQPTVNSPPPVNANLSQTVTLTFTSSSAFDVSGTGTGNPTGVAYTSGGNITYNGWTFQISGTPQAGDVFTLSANTSGVGDNRNALLLAAQQTQTNLNGGVDSYANAYGNMVANVATKTEQSDLTRAAQQSMLTQSRTNRDAVSGVNLDEEAAELVRYQQAYQAAAQVLNTANQLFDTILAAIR